MGRGRALRVLFVFRRLVVGGEETEVRLLVKNLDPTRHRVEVVSSLFEPGTPEQTHRQLRELGVPLDVAPYGLSPEEKVGYLAEKVAGYDVVVACQSVPFVYPALERLAPEARPPLIEHGGVVAEALELPKHLTARYVGVCRTIRDAAAARMPQRPHHAIEIPSMVDLSEFDPADREGVREEFGVPEGVPLIGWVGRLDRKKRVEDFLRAAAIVRIRHPEARFVVVGGPYVSMPEYADELGALASELELGDALTFLGDRPDVPRLLSGLDIFVWLSRNEGMPHVVSEAGAAALPVVATRDNGSEEQIVDGVTGLFVPHESPRAVASELGRLIRDPRLRRRLGRNLRQKVESEYGAAVVARQWEELLDRVVAETERHRVRARRQ